MKRVPKVNFRRRRAVRWRRVPAFVALPLALALTGPVAPAAAADGDFYMPPSTLQCSNGDVLRAEPATASYGAALQIAAQPARVNLPATVTRMMYCSRDNNGVQIAVTGTVLIPLVPWTGPGERPVVGFGHGTVGLGDQCAVSKRLATGEPGESSDAPILEAYLTAGYAIALTDYQGLGTPGAHQYLMRKAQGQAVIDAVRAAQQMSQVDLPDSGPVFFAGFSQGGFSAASAAEIQPTYAPELKLKGLVAAGVPGDLAATVQFLEGSPSDGILLFVVNGLNAAYPKAGIMRMFNEAGLQTVNTAAGQCVEDVTASGSIRSWTLTKDGRTISDHLVNDFGVLLKEQMIGQLKPAVPVVTGISKEDDVVPYEANRGTAKRWCNLGATVQFETVLAPSHGAGSVAVYAESLPWLSGRLLGLPAPTNCGAY